MVMLVLSSTGEKTQWRFDIDGPEPEPTLIDNVKQVYRVYVLLQNGDKMCVRLYVARGHCHGRHL